MTYTEVKDKIISGDKIINTFKVRGGNYFEVYRNGHRILALNYSQFKKLTDGLKCEVYAGGLTKHIYTVN